MTKVRYSIGDTKYIGFISNDILYNLNFDKLTIYALHAVPFDGMDDLMKCRLCDMNCMIDTSSGPEYPCNTFPLRDGDKWRFEVYSGVYKVSLFIMSKLRNDKDM